MTHLAKQAHVSSHLQKSYLVWLMDVDFWFYKKVTEDTTESQELIIWADDTPYTISLYKQLSKKANLKYQCYSLASV